TTFFRVGGTGSYFPYNPAIAKPVVSADGATTVSFFSVDQTGNTEPAKAISVLIDRSAPAVSMTGPAANLVSSNTTPTLTATASDATSGVASVQLQLSSDNGATWANVGADTTAPYSAT